MQQTEKYWNLINRIVLIAIIVMAGVGVAMAFAPKVTKYNEDQQKLKDLKQQIELVEAEERLIKEYIERFSNDPEFVKKVAHEVGYACPDEVIFHFPEETGSY